MPSLMIQVASYTGEEDANLNISLEYAATIDASNDTIGRKSTVPVHLHFLPSLEVWPLFSHGPSKISFADSSGAQLQCQTMVSLMHACILQVTGVSFHEHHMPAAARGRDTSSRDASLRRTSSLGDIDRSSSGG